MFRGCRARRGRSGPCSADRGRPPVTSAPKATNSRQALTNGDSGFMGVAAGTSPGSSETTAGAARSRNNTAVPDGSLGARWRDRLSARRRDRPEPPLPTSRERRSCPWASSNDPSARPVPAASRQGPGRVSRRRRSPWASSNDPSVRPGPVASRQRRGSVRGGRSPHRHLRIIYRRTRGRRHRRLTRRHVAGMGIGGLQGSARRELRTRVTHGALQSLDRSAQVGGRIQLPRRIGTRHGRLEQTVGDHLCLRALGDFGGGGGRRARLLVRWRGGADGGETYRHQHGCSQ